jgi:hypothetical protein
MIYPFEMSLAMKNVGFLFIFFVLSNPNIMPIWSTNIISMDLYYKGNTHKVIHICNISFLRASRLKVRIHMNNHLDLKRVNMSMCLVAFMLGKDM